MREHWFTSFSYRLSITYIVIISMAVPLIIFVTNRPNLVLLNAEYKKKWGIFYEGLRLDDKLSRIFQSLGIFR